jgi:hypothetical protein
VFQTVNMIGMRVSDDDGRWLNARSRPQPIATAVNQDSCLSVCQERRRMSPVAAAPDVNVSACAKKGTRHAVFADRGCSQDSIKGER